MLNINLSNTYNFLDKISPVIKPAALISAAVGTAGVITMIGSQLMQSHALNYLNTLSISLYIGYAPHLTVLSPILGITQMSALSLMIAKIYLIGLVLCGGAAAGISLILIACIAKKCIEKYVMEKTKNLQNDCTIKQRIEYLNQQKNKETSLLESKI